MKYSRAMINTWAKLGSSGAFGMAAMELPELDDRTVMLTADVCFYSGLNRFSKKYPDRMYNMGIAEQNMVGVAGGMAKEGLIPYATTYATFASMRSADQVRVTMGYMGLGIKLVGLTAGLSAGILGPTHISVEDIAVMRTIPNVTILSPADCTETVKATLASLNVDGPVYLRLTGTMNAPVVYEEDYDFQVGKAITLKEGKDIAVIATGSMVYNSLKAAEILGQKGLSVRVIDMHTIKPLDEEIIKEVAGYKYIVTVEEHSKIGGLGSAVADVLVRLKEHGRFLSIGFDDIYHHAGDYEHLVKQYGLDSEAIAEKITGIVE